MIFLARDVNLCAQFCTVLYSVQIYFRPIFCTDGQDLLRMQKQEGSQQSDLKSLLIFIIRILTGFITLDTLFTIIVILSMPGKEKGEYSHFLKRGFTTIKFDLQYMYVTQLFIIRLQCYRASSH